MRYLYAEVSRLITHEREALIQSYKVTALGDKNEKCNPALEKRPLSMTSAMKSVCLAPPAVFCQSQTNFAFSNLAIYTLEERA